jgi:hypothetical protein
LIGAENLVFALAVEDVVRKTTIRASRRVGETTTTLAETTDSDEQVPRAEALQNGSLISYWIDKIAPFDEFASLKLDEIKYVGRGEYVDKNPES